MSALETQVGQIYISNKRLARAFVSLQSEKIVETGAELYVLLEITGLSAKKAEEYDRIAKMFLNDLKRNFRRKNPNSFENSIAQINNDLAETAAKGSTSWVGKIDCCLAVREENNLYIATSGKVQAFLFRNGQLSNLADSPAKPNPLKTFENFALGRIKENDFLVLSSSELFNYISLDKFKSVLEEEPLAAGCQKIADSINELADNTLSFGTFILQFSGEAGAISPAVFSAPDKSAPAKQAALAVAGALGGAFKSAGQSALNYAKNPTIPKIPKIDPRLITEQVTEHAKRYSDIKRIRELPKQKKFFLLSAVIFAILLIINLSVLAHANSIKKHTATLTAQLTAVQEKISQANATSIYSKNSTETLGLLNEAEDLLNQVPNDKVIAQKRADTAAELDNLLNTVGHVKKVQATEENSYNFQSATKSISEVRGIPDVGLRISDSSRVYSAKNYFYILDSQKKRLILINKNKSTLVEQFGSDSFSNPTDFVVNDTGTTAYIQDSGKVLSISLN